MLDHSNKTNNLTKSKYAIEEPIYHKFWVDAG